MFFSFNAESSLDSVDDICKNDVSVFIFSPFLFVYDLIFLIAAPKSPP